MPHLKVSDEVYDAVLRLQGFLQLRDGKRHTIDEVLRDILTFVSTQNRYRGYLVPIIEGQEGKPVFQLLPENEGEEESEEEEDK